MGGGGGYKSAVLRESTSSVPLSHERFVSACERTTGVKLV